MEAEFLGQFTDCTQLRKKGAERYMQRDFGSLNISAHGHPTPSGALTRDMLCTFRRADGVCAPPPVTEAGEPPHRVPVRAVEKALRMQQAAGPGRSFRSIEQLHQGRVNAARRNQNAHCLQLLQSSAQK